MKYGIAIIYAGLLALALDYHHATHYIFPVCMGAIIVAMSHVAQRLENAPGKLRIWHFMAMEWNFLMFVMLVSVAGIRFALNLNPVSIFCEISVLALSIQCLWIQSDSFQEEHKYLDKLELEKRMIPPRVFRCKARHN